MSDRAHWESIYGRKRSDEVSWFRPHLERSLAWVDACQLPRDARIVDAGGGASTLVDDLLDRGYTGVTVVDLSSAALEQARGRLGDRAALARWVQGDVTEAQVEPHTVDLWHDRAVLHFLVDDAPREAYLAQIRQALAPGGRVILGTFGPGAPERCSNLPVVRRTPDELAALLGPDFVKVDEAREEHTTPWGSPQAFSYALCARRAP